MKKDRIDCIDRASKKNALNNGSLPSSYIPINFTMHGGPEMRKSGRDPSEETSPSLDLRMSHGYKNRIREQLQNPFESFKIPAFFHCTAYSILLHRKLQVLKQPPEDVLSDRFVSRFFQQISHRI
jgi:hypothetical protein